MAKENLPDGKSLKRRGAGAGSPGLRPGAEKEDLALRAYRRLLYLLDKRDYTHKQLEDKLKKGGYSPEERAEALGKVTALGLVNDTSYARRYLECFGGRKSLKKMRCELMQKGIEREILDEVFSEYEDEHPEREETERELIVRALEKRHFDPESRDRKEFSSHMAYLMRRGFRSSDVYAVMKAFGSDDDPAGAEGM